MLSTGNIMKPYHRVWIKHNGPIPKDKNGRSMELHHIDGNHSNDDIDNLRLVTIEEHYDIHYDQKDWEACYYMTIRMNKTPEEISRECSTLQRRLVREGKHHLLGGEIQGKSSRDRVKNDTHNFMKRKDGTSLSSDRVKNGTHNFMKRKDGTSLSSDRVTAGTHNFIGLNERRVEEGTHHLLGSSSNNALLAAGKHPSQKHWKCEHCNVTGMGSGNYKRYHGDKCKMKREK